jgi:Uma2 family endonuclease
MRSDEGRFAVSTTITGPALNPTGAITVPVEQFWRLSVKHYHEMIDAGILTEGDPIELLDGWLVYKMSKKRLHSFATQNLRLMLEKLLPPGWFVDAQEPLTTETSEPEPDISVVRGQRHDYRHRHPGPADVGLVVEVSDASLDRDQKWKKSIYAQARVVLYWILNLPEERIEVYAQPACIDGRWDYQSHQSFEKTAAVPFSLDGQLLGTVTLTQILDEPNAAADPNPAKGP